MNLHSRAWSLFMMHTQKTFLLPILRLAFALAFALALAFARARALVGLS